MSPTIAAALVAAGLRLAASHSYAEGAPPGFSGGFKEESCHACHFHAEPNTAPGGVAIDGIPARFTAGQRYTLTITLTRPDMKRAGFQLTARFKDTGAQAGTLAPGRDAGERAGVESSSGIQYAGQKKAGSTIVENGVARWPVEWTAPAAGGPVIFHVAANAADGNESADGDFVYTATAEAASLPAQAHLCARRVQPDGNAASAPRRIAALQPPERRSAGPYPTRRPAPPQGL